MLRHYSASLTFKTVCITIYAVTEGIEPVERILRISRDTPVVPIGRASKSLNKGLKGAIDNAWFDSPVMSRNHAELYLEDGVSENPNLFQHSCRDRLI